MLAEHVSQPICSLRQKDTGAWGKSLASIWELSSAAAGSLGVPRGCGRCPNSFSTEVSRVNSRHVLSAAAFDF